MRHLCRQAIRGSDKVASAFQVRIVRNKQNPATAYFLGGCWDITQHRRKLS